MTRLCVWWCWLLLLVMALPLFARAQVLEFLPELDVYTKLTPGTRFWFQAKETREDGAPTQAEIGPSFDFYVKPLNVLKVRTLFDLDDSKQQLLVLSVGYRYLPSPGNPSENRILLMATPNVPLKGGLLVSDRNRMEVNFTNGNATWRYRNRLTLQKTVALRSYHPAIYASAEFYYNSRYDKWSSTAITGGWIFPLGKKIEINPYYEHDNATGVTPNQQTNAVGLILNLFFRREQK
jgi:hypothetical protein